MKIYGLQKMTLLDFPGRVACTVFLGGCDFRCPFCHNYELADGTAQPEYTEEEFFAFIESRRALMDGVAITGGEPLLHKDLPRFMERIRAAGYPVKLDTNGYHPETLEEILDAGLADYVAMDIKNSPEKYALTCGVETLDLTRIEKSAALLMNGKTDYEFRTTVVKELHTAADIGNAAKMIAGAKRYFLQRFTDRDTVPFGNLNPPSYDEMREYAALARGYVPETNLRGVD